MNVDFLEIFKTLSDKIKNKDGLGLKKNLLHFQSLINFSLFSLKDSEIQKLEKLCLIGNSLPSGLYFQGIVVKSLNDESRPQLDPHKILNILNEKFNSNLTDFIFLILNKITYAKMECKSANFGDLAYKCIVNPNDYNSIKFPLLNFRLKTNLEINRIYYIKNQKFSELIDNFNFTLKNLTDNSFYFFYLNNQELNFNSNEIINQNLILQNIEEWDFINIKMMVPTNLIDFENTIDKNNDISQKFLIKFRSKFLLSFFVRNNIKYSELMIEIKNSLLRYIAENIENLLEDKYMDTSSPNIFSYDIDNKCYIEFENITLSIDQSNINYSVNF